MSYPHGYGRCIMCGAERSEPCTVISGANEWPGDVTGADRPSPHAMRSRLGDGLEPPEGFLAVKDEPNHYRDEPHTAECGGPGVCPLDSTEGAA